MILRRGHECTELDVVVQTREASQATVNSYGNRSCGVSNLVLVPLGMNCYELEAQE